MNLVQLYFDDISGHTKRLNSIVDLKIVTRMIFLNRFSTQKPIIETLSEQKSKIDPPYLYLFFSLGFQFEDL